ncbi:MAG: rod shape-determining protein MreD [Bacteroidetes bacterium]|nr:rod shape-determining protein MreD [Bacteroidota bacterium]MBU2471721.1 rod shape-determining protein MreD [Bacteroidota bacterium]
MNKHVKFILTSIFLIVVQTTVIRYLSLEGIIPDLLLIMIVYISITEGQISGTLYGFGIGLLFDIITGDVIGISSLSKSMAGFISGYFFNENKIELTMGSYRFLLILLFVSSIHNLIYFLIYVQGSEISTLYAISKVGLTSALYTTTVSILMVLVFARKYSFKT